MLVPLTASLYVPGTLDEADKVLVDIGTGYFIEVYSIDKNGWYWLCSVSFLCCSWSVFILSRKQWMTEKITVRGRSICWNPTLTNFLRYVFWMTFIWIRNFHSLSLIWCLDRSWGDNKEESLSLFLPLRYVWYSLRLIDYYALELSSYRSITQFSLTFTKIVKLTVSGNGRTRMECNGHKAIETS